MPANAIDANTAYERAFQVIFYHLLPGGWLTLLLKKSPASWKLIDSPRGKNHCSRRGNK